MVGTILTLILIMLVSLAILAGLIAAATTSEVSIPSNTVLQVKLDKTIMDREPGMPFFFTFGGASRSTGLNDILNNIKKAKDDDKIKGIVLELTDIPAGISTILEIRSALEDFRKSGKFIYAYSNMMSQSAYYLATVADKIYLNPQGGILFKGISSELMFLKGTLDKLDVKVQIIRHGKFKAATEPLFLDKMSPENRKQITELITSVWGNLVDSISGSRNIPAEALNLIADSLSISNAEDAVKYGIADSLLYTDQFLALMKTKLGLTEKENISYVTMEKYSDVAVSLKTSSRADKIAVIFAQGNVVDGQGDERSIGGDAFAKAIRKAREDKKVKAIVLRVNSPGGSALASDIILREVILANKEKPVVASFGDVAASGGYYIACGAKMILADPTTITGSIGVWAAIPNFKGLLNNKLGMTFDRANTNTNADFISVTEPLPPYQTMVLQKEINHIYDVFVNHVSEGRGMTVAQVDSIGQGRIWSGVDAKRIGLIDGFGGLEAAIDSAASLAGIKDYRIVALPEKKDPFTQIIDDLMGNSTQAAIEKELGENYMYYRYMKEIREMKGIQARLPFMITLN